MKLLTTTQANTLSTFLWPSVKSISPWMWAHRGGRQQRQVTGAGAEASAGCGHKLNKVLKTPVSSLGGLLRRNLVGDYNFSGLPDSQEGLLKMKSLPGARQTRSTYLTGLLWAVTRGASLPVCVTSAAIRWSLHFTLHDSQKAHT